METLKNSSYPEPRIWKSLSLYDDHSLHRREECRFYDKCLDLAAKLNWPGFTCSYCPLHPKNKEEAAKWKRKKSLGGDPTLNSRLGKLVGVQKTE